MMISWGYKLLKSKTFLATAAIVGFATYTTMDKENFTDNMFMDEETQASKTLQEKTHNPNYYTSKLRASKKSKIMGKNNIDIETDEMLYAKAMMNADKNFNRDVAEHGIPRIMDKIASNDNRYRDTSVAEDGSINYYNQSNHTMASVSVNNNKNANVIRTTSSYNDINNISTQDDSVTDDTKVTENTTDFQKEHTAPNAKVSDNSTIYPGYITGSVIPSNENNTSNNTGVLTHNNYVILDTNQSIFPSTSKEAQHDCYFDVNAQMQCRKSITTCIENAEEGLTCTVSYYLKGLWYIDPTYLTIESEESWIKEHLQMRTTFAIDKFLNNYYDDRYAVTSLIRPDLNTAKSSKLIQLKKHLTQKTVLDEGILTLLENNNSSVDTSLLLRGTRFGTGHQVVKGGDSEFLKALKKFLSTFMHADDSDVYERVDYWTIMDANHTMGDGEDFALTAMEWLLLNGVDPKYITLTELKTETTNTVDIVLVLETQEPHEKWIIRDENVVKDEDIYPNGYEAFIINEYRYVD